MVKDIACTSAGDGGPKLVIGIDGKTLILEGEAIYRGAGSVLEVIAEVAV